MAHALRYYKNITHADGTNIRIEFHEKDGIAPAMELGDVIQVLNLEIQGGDDIDAPIVKTQLNFTLVDAPDHHEAKTKKCGAWEEFYSPDATHWKVLIFAEGQQMWGGYITPDSYHEVLTYRSGISFVARDNIGHLNDFPFDAAGNAEGMISMYDLVQTAWRKIDSPMLLTTNSANWLKCEGTSGIYTYMNVSAFEGKNWYEVLESALYAYGLVMRYVGDNKVAVYPLREMPYYGKDSISVANVVFETGAERELSPAARRIEETDEYDIEESLAQPLVDNEKNFTGEVESVSFTYLNTPVTSYFWKLNRTAEGTGWINGNAPAYFNPLAYAHASNVDSNDLKYLWLSSADGLASGFNGRCIQYSRYIEACDIKANIQFGSLYAFDDDLLRRALYTPSQLRVYYSVKIEQGGITNTLNDKGEWVSNTFVLNALTNERLLSIDIPKGDFTGEVLLTIRIYFIANYGAVYCPIYSMTFTAVNAPLLTTNNINTNYNEKNNVILTRSPKIAPAMDKPFMVGVIKNGIYRKEGTRYFPTRLWSWNGNGAQQMAVYNHLQLLCYHGKPNNILTGNIVNADITDFAKIYRWNGTEHIIVSGVLNLISGFIENAQLREFVHYDAMWGDLTDTADFPEVDGGQTTTVDGGASSGGTSASYANTTEVNVSGVLVIDDYMSANSTNPVQNRIVKAYIDEVKEKADAAEKVLEIKTTQETISTSNGYWKLSSEVVGSYVTVGKVSDGAWVSVEQPVKAGETYIITGTGGNTSRPYALVDSRMKLLAIADAGVTVNGYTLTVAQDGKLYCSMLKDASYSVIKEESKAMAFEERDKAAEEAHQYLYDEIHPMREGSQDITPYFGVGYYTYSSVEVGTKTEATKNFGASWHCVRHAVKAGEEYVITGAGGGGARLYCVVNNEGIIKAIADPGAVLQNHSVKVEEDGVLFCSCDAAVIASYSVIRKYYVEIVKDGIDVTWKNGSFEFGRTCDCDYTAPMIDRWSYPELGQRVATINAWYDELVAEFPQYVSRESCDAVMASLGISKPAAIAPYPMYMYKFISPKAPNSSGMNPEITSARHIKAFVITGTHPEFMAIWDLINTMRLVCRSWRDDKNLEELRWNADIYIIPCFNPYGIDNATRTNENAVDLNRNAPTSDWYERGEGTQTYSGKSAGSEYSTKVLMHYLEAIQPQVFIDHHNTNVGSGDDEGDGKNMIYTHCAEQIGIDVASVVISQMTRKWKDRYTDTFPSVEADPTTMFGFTSFDDIAGSLGKYATEQGALGSTYESNNGILYKNGEYSTANRVHDNELISTCATEGFINYLVRILKVYSEQIGVQQKQ